MALYPAAKHRLIKPGSNDPRIVPRVGILHVDAVNAVSLYEYFNGKSGGIESHFHIPKSSKNPVEQYRDTGWEADANHLANPFAISVETQGYANEMWSVHQLNEIKNLMVWCREEHGILLQQTKTWDGKGWGYHTLFGAPGKWTPVNKSCPGPLRKEQFHDILVPWMKGFDDDMFEEADRKRLEKLETIVIELNKNFDAYRRRSWEREKKALNDLAEIKNLLKR